MSPWYVWLVWFYDSSVGPGESGPMRIVGVFSSREKALEAAFVGCALTVLPFDEAYVEVPGREWLPVEWVLEETE